MDRPFRTDLERSFLILDGAHNPDGAVALKKSLEIYFPAQRFRYIFWGISR